MTALVRSAADALLADAVALGAAVDHVSAFACRGRLADAPVHEHSAFYGASVTKQFVGLATARAVVSGLVEVDDPIDQWLPKLTGPMGSVRLRHLIHHTSSLPDVADPASGVPRSNADVIDRFRQLAALELEPGVRYAYNNAGYVLLAEAVARSRNQPVDRLADELFALADLADPRLGGPVVRLPGGMAPPGTIGDGGLWISIRDLVRWLQACNDQVFGAEAAQLAEHTTTLVDGSSLDYAWGVRVSPTPVGRVITHGGSWDPWLAKTVRIPERHVAVAVVGVGATELDVSRAGTELATAIASP